MPSVALRHGTLWLLRSSLTSRSSIADVAYHRQALTVQICCAGAHSGASSQVRRSRRPGALGMELAYEQVDAAPQAPSVGGVAQDGTRNTTIASVSPIVGSQGASPSTKQSSTAGYRWSRRGRPPPKSLQEHAQRKGHVRTATHFLDLEPS